MAPGEAGRMTACGEHKKRGNTTAAHESYKAAIHRAIIHCGGVGRHKQEWLDWSLVGTFSSEKAEANRRHLKATLALLPSVDHVGDGLGEADFKHLRLVNERRQA